MAQHALLQLPHVGPVINKNLRSGSIKSIQDVLTSAVTKIDMAAKRKIGHSVLAAARKIPVYTIEVEQPSTRASVTTVTVRQTNPQASPDRWRSNATVFVFSEKSDVCFLLKSIKCRANEPQIWTWELPGLSLGDHVTIDVIQNSITGMDKRSMFFYTAPNNTSTTHQQQPVPAHQPEHVAPARGTQQQQQQQYLAEGGYEIPPPLTQMPAQRPEHQLQPLAQRAPRSQQAPLDLSEYVYVDGQTSTFAQQQEDRRYRPSKKRKQAQQRLPHTAPSSGYGGIASPGRGRRRKLPLQQQQQQQQQQQPDMQMDMMRARVQQSGMTHVKRLLTNKPAFKMLPNNGPVSSQPGIFAMTAPPSSSSSSSSSFPAFQAAPARVPEPPSSSHDMDIDFGGAFW
jgi:hypothetical protein